MLSTFGGMILRARELETQLDARQIAAALSGTREQPVTDVELADLRTLAHLIVRIGLELGTEHELDGESVPTRLLEAALRSLPLTPPTRAHEDIQQLLLRLSRPGRETLRRDEIDELLALLEAVIELIVRTPLMDPSDERALESMSGPALVASWTGVEPGMWSPLLTVWADGRNQLWRTFSMVVRQPAFVLPPIFDVQVLTENGVRVPVDLPVGLARVLDVWSGPVEYGHAVRRCERLLDGLGKHAQEAGGDGTATLIAGSHGAEYCTELRNAMRRRAGDLVSRARPASAPDGAATQWALRTLGRLIGYTEDWAARKEIPASEYWHPAAGRYGSGIMASAVLLWRIVATLPLEGQMAVMRHRYELLTQIAPELVIPPPGPELLAAWSS